MNTYKKSLPANEFKFEQFKLKWMIDHDFTLLDLIKELEVLSEDYPYASLMELFEEWESDRGFGGMIWPCYDEWLEVEGKEDGKEMESKKVRVYDIIWDVDDDEDLEFLPIEIIIPDEVAFDEDGEIQEEEISDYITNETGFCHKGFKID